MATDTSERGLERLICTALAGHSCDPANAGGVAEGRSAGGGVGWSGGSPHAYDREFCVDRVQLAAFLRATQPQAAASLALHEDGPTCRKFLARLQGEISKRSTIDVLRHGIKHGPHDLSLFYGTPSAGNEQARERFARNRFTVVRQLRDSRDETQRALDIGLFINGLPVFTFELKNNLTKQTVGDAVEQYRKDRNPREKLFELGRCVAHFAVDEGEVRFCTHLKGKASWFLPFNRGWNDGAGNPPNPRGVKIDYLWREVLTRESLTNILENYAQVVVVKDEKTGRKRRTQIWPRYHQSRRLLPNASYFAFTATPKNKTLEIFGEPDPQSEGAVRHGAFHSYTMKQAIQEKFILDVLAHYTPVDATTSSPRRCRTIRSSTSRRPSRSCGDSSRVMSTRSASRPRSWSTTFTPRCWGTARSADRRGRWWLPTASSARSSTSRPSVTTCVSARARIGPLLRSPASRSSAARG